MPSTYSNIKIQLMATGENNTTWGNVTNINLGTALEEAIVGSADVTFASGNVTLTLTDTNASQTARHVRLRCTGVTGGSTRDLIVPAIEKPYLVQNDCLNSIVVKNATGTGVTVPAGKTMWVYNDGTNVVDAVNHLSSLTLGTALPVGQGGTGASTFTANGIIYGNTTSALLATAAGTTGQVLVGNTGGAPSWATLSGIGVTTFSAGTTGFTPSSATSGAITLAGTLGVANGGTGNTTFLSNYLLKGNGTSAVTSSIVYDNGTNVGIATSSPTERLTVAGNTKIGEGVASSTSKLMVNTLSGVAAGIQLFQDANESWIIQNPASTNVLTFSNSGTERMRLNAAGDLGIGTSSPGARLETSVTSAGATVEVLRLSNPGAGANTQAQINFATTSTSYATITGGYGAAAPQMTFNLPSATAGNYIWQISGTERMRLDAAGNVGIGTSSPDATLTVEGTYGLLTVKSTTGSKRVALGGDAFTDAFVGTTTAHNFSVIAGGNVIGTFTTGGNVGIGTASPGFKLDVRGATGNILNVSDNSQSILLGTVAGGGGQIETGLFTRFVVNSSERMRITSAGDVGIGTTTPGGKLEILNNGVALRLNTTFVGGNSVDLNPFVLGVSNDGFSITVGGNIRQIIDSAGNVAFGTTVTNNKFLVTYANPVSVPAAGAGGHCTAFGTVGYGLATGAITNGNAYLQATRWDTIATNYDLLLQPNGGNVGIGTGSPGARLDVRGNIQSRSSNDILDMGVSSGIPFIQAYNNASGITAIPLRFFTGTDERMRVTAGGNLLVGTTTALSRLTVGSNGNALNDDAITIFGSLSAVSTGQAISWYQNTASVRSGYVALNTNSGGGESELHFGTTNAFGINNATTKMVILGGGNVGIGTTNPGGKLEVSNGASECLLRIRGGTSGSSSPQLQFYGNSSDHNWTIVGNHTAAMTFNKGTFGALGSELMRLDANGNLGIGTATTSYNKLNIGDDGNGLATVGLSFTTNTTERAFITMNGSSGEMRLSAGFPVYGGFSTFYTAGSEKMRITSAGNVGIGTSAPNAKLDVVGGASQRKLQISGSAFGTTIADVYIGRTGVNSAGLAQAPSLQFGNDTDASGVILQGSNQFQIFTNNAGAGWNERMRIDASGNLGVGTSSPAFYGGRVVSNADGASIAMFAANNSDAGSASQIVFDIYRNGTRTGSITNTNAATAYNTSSDERLKHDIVNAPEASSLIDAIKVRSFKWNADNSEQRYGFVAQELLPVAPEAVSVPADPDNMMGVDYSKLVPMLVKEIQSLRARVAQLEGK